MKFYKKMTIWSEHVWDSEFILRKNAMSLQRRYLCKFPTSSMFSAATPLIVACHSFIDDDNNNSNTDYQFI